MSTQITTPQDPEPTEPKAKAEGQPPEGGETRPEWLPEKFESPEAMAKAYGDLEAKQSTPPPSEGSDDLTLPTPDDTPPEGQTVIDAANKEFNEKGELSEETYKALQEKANIPKAIVDSYIAGQVAVGATYSNSVMELAGGEDGYKQMSQWAANNLSDAEQEAYDTAVSSGNVEQARLAVQGVMARYQAAGYGTSPLSGKTGGPAVAPIESKAQLIEIMGSDKYKTDPAYREKVDKRLLVSGSLFPTRKS